MERQPLTLIPIDDAVIGAARTSAAALERAVERSLGDSGQLYCAIVDQTGRLLASKPRDPEWGCFLVADDSVATIIGSCGYKYAPAADGSVEIAYGIFPPHEGQGHATAVARELVARAGRRKVIAHTLPERNASCRILEKLGFACVGEVEDPEDGPVWRWELDAR